MTHKNPSQVVERPNGDNKGEPASDFRVKKIFITTNQKPPQTTKIEINKFNYIKI